MYNLGDRWIEETGRAVADTERYQACERCGRAGHDVSRDRPQNAPNADAFGLNRLRRFGYENTCGHFDFGAAHHYRGGLYRPAFHKRPGNCATGPLSGTSTSLYLCEVVAPLPVDRPCDRRTWSVCSVCSCVGDFGGGFTKSVVRILPGGRSPSTISRVSLLVEHDM